MVPARVTAKENPDIDNVATSALARCDPKLSAIGTTAEATMMDSRLARRRGSRHQNRDSRARIAPNTPVPKTRRIGRGIRDATAPPRFASAPPLLARAPRPPLLLLAPS